MREFAFNPFNLFNLFIKKFILFLLPYFLLLHLLNTSSSSTVTSVYSNSDSDYLKKTNNNKFKKSLKAIFAFKYTTLPQKMFAAVAAVTGYGIVSMYHRHRQSQKIISEVDISVFQLFMSLIGSVPT